MKPVLSWKTKIIYIKKVPAGNAISYGGTFKTKKESTIATLAVGYGDGYSRMLSNKGYVLIRGRKARITGRVTMDMTMVDAGDCQEVRVGDEVVIIGRSGEESISVTEVARKAGTIEHEVICGIGPRVPRVYLRNGELACVQGYTFAEAKGPGTLMEPFVS